MYHTTYMPIQRDPTRGSKIMPYQKLTLTNSKQRPQSRLIAQIAALGSVDVLKEGIQVIFNA